MYYELGQFSKKVFRQKAVWISGEFFTSLIVGLASFLFFGWGDISQKYISICYDNLGNLLTVESIIFGFAMSSLLHSVQIANYWRKDGGIEKIASKIVDWTTLTVFSMLLLIVYSLLLLIFDELILSHFSKALTLFCFF